MEPGNVTKTVEVFYSYHANAQDEDLMQQLEKHLTTLIREKHINTWSIQKLKPGDDRLQVINAHLNVADIILLLVSPEFLASDNSYKIEVKRAMERSEADEVLVIPIILRPVDWAGTLFSSLEPLPIDGKPVTTWENRDNAFYDISLGIRSAAETVLAKYTIENSRYNPDQLLQKPQEVLAQDYIYDIALAFAPEDRAYAEALANSLRYHGVKVFCYGEGIDKEMELALWGKSFHSALFDASQKPWRYCVLFLSRYYARRMPRQKRDVILTRALREIGYILPIHLDETTFSDINEDAAFAIKWHKIGLQAISEFLARKVLEVSHIVTDQ